MSQYSPWGVTRRLTTDKRGQKMSRAAVARFTFRVPFNCLTRPGRCCSFLFFFFCPPSVCTRGAAGWAFLFFFPWSRLFGWKWGGQEDETAETAGIYPGCHKLVMKWYCKITWLPPTESQNFPFPLIRTRGPHARPSVHGIQGWI